jgi:hypothetical protein
MPNQFLSQNQFFPLAASDSHQSLPVGAHGRIAALKTVLPRAFLGGVPGAYRSRPLALRGPSCKRGNQETSGGRPLRRFSSISDTHEGGKKAHDTTDDQLHPAFPVDLKPSC